MLAIPPALLDVLHLGAGAQVGIDIVDGRLIVEPSAAREYTLQELLAQCHPGEPGAYDDREWLDGPATGRELL